MKNKQSVIFKWLMLLFGLLAAGAFYSCSSPGYRAESRCCTGKQGISGGERAGYGRRPDRNISVRGNGPEKVNRNKAQSLGMIWKQLLCLSRKSAMYMSAERSFLRGYT